MKRVITDDSPEVTDLKDELATLLTSFEDRGVSRQEILLTLAEVLVGAIGEEFTTNEVPHPRPLTWIMRAVACALTDQHTTDPSVLMNILSELDIGTSSLRTELKALRPIVARSSGVTTANVAAETGLAKS